MPVFFVHSQSIRGNRLVLEDPSLIHHLVRVLRIREGEILYFVDEGQRRYRVRILSRASRLVEGEVLDREVRSAPPPLWIHLGQGLPKGDRLSTIIQWATELGVSRITPLFTQRCLVRWEGTREDRVRRWRQIALEAAQQSGRWEIPEVEAPISLEAFLRRDPHWDLGLMLWEGAVQTPLRQVLQSFSRISMPVRCLVLVGPEGGWTPEEVDQARSRGLVPVHLGERILRTEHAGPTLLALLQFILGDLG